MHEQICEVNDEHICEVNDEHMCEVNDKHICEVIDEQISETNDENIHESNAEQLSVLSTEQKSEQDAGKLLYSKNTEDKHLLVQNSACECGNKNNNRYSIRRDEAMTGSEKKKPDGSFIISMIITVIAILFNIYMMIIEGSSNPWNIVSFIILLFVMVYTVTGYKKPHGNMLRYSMMAYAFFLGIYAVNTPDRVVAVQNIMLVAAVLTAYMSGRLNKIEKNKILSWVIGALLLIAPVIMFITGINTIGEYHSANLISSAISYINLPIQWCGLAVSYFLRYEEHKHAGENKVK